MDGLLPFDSTSRLEPPTGSRVVGIDESAAETVFDVLSADTTRAVLVAVYDEPGTTSEIADRVDTSLQNANYHLDKLRDADLVEVADTRYSAQGREMDVYVPTSESIVVVAGDEETTSSLRETLRRLLGAVGVVAVASVVVQQLFAAPGSPYTFTTRPDAPTTILDHLAGALASPGVVFFAGGLFAVFVLCAWHVLSD